ncbi:MAG: FAD-dependent oxidoreductase, partial [Bacteroidales bacterium]|nr:FAD-dependent oxidoreductase [Bacteroidales bacterium]
MLVIGSGLGGLSTALRLQKRGYDVTIVEKNNT